MKIVRDLITEWKEKEVITTVRVTKGKTKLQGVGLAEKSRKHLENYGCEVDATGRQTGGQGLQIAQMDAMGGRHLPPEIPRKCLVGAKLGICSKPIMD